LTSTESKGTRVVYLILSLLQINVDNIPANNFLVVIKTGLTYSLAEEETKLMIRLSSVTRYRLYPSAAVAMKQPK